MALTKLNSLSIPPNTVVANDLADGSIATAKLADNAVTSAKIGVDVIVAEDLAANSVTVSEITDAAVSEAKLNISNAGSNGQFLSKQSGNTGGLTWADAGISGITSSADATAMTIDSSERIVTPSQPLFSASSISAVSGGSLHSATPIYNIAGQTSGTAQAVSFGKIWNNVGSYWSNTTGVFTVPVAGRYYCYFNNNYHENDNWPNALFMHETTIVAQAWTNHNESAEKYSSLVASTIVVAAVNDKLWPAYRSDYDPPYVETNLGYHSCQILLIG